MTTIDQLMSVDMIQKMATDIPGQLILQYDMTVHNKGMMGYRVNENKCR